MIAVDTNILIYAHRGDSPFHLAAVEAMDKLAASGKPWCVVWQCAHEFISIVTNPKIYRPASTLDQCLSEIENWRACSTFCWIAEGSAHWKVLKSLVREGRVTGGLVHDARIAAVCIQHGVETLWSVDRDFSRFPALVVTNPLVSSNS